jgi:hypothetical protein
MPVLRSLLFLLLIGCAGTARTGGKGGSDPSDSVAPPSGTDTGGGEDTSTPGVDADGDGYTSTEDCDDSDASRYLPVDTYVGSITEADLANFCAGYCERELLGNLSIEDSIRFDLSELTCLRAVQGDVSI